MFFAALAGLPQTPTASPWDLRESRKRQPYLRGTCGTPANAKANAARLAGTPANAKANAVGLAGTPANAKANAAGLAGTPANAPPQPGTQFWEPPFVCPAVFHFSFFSLYVSISASSFVISSPSGMPVRSLIIPTVAMGSITLAMGVRSMANFSLMVGRSSSSFG